FTTPPRTNEQPHWTRPLVVVEIKFNEWTAEGKLRQPVFVGVRDDKSPRDVVREPARGPKKKSAAKKKPAAKHTAVSVRPETLVRQLEGMENDGGSGTLSLPTGSLDVSNLGKVFFPETKHTKGDVMRYYAHVAKYLLPAIADRPLVMKRFPNGIRGKA